jgi:hypothetical protein
VVTINLASMTKEVMSPNLEGMINCCQIKTMSGVILFMLP